jgi:ligand-binding sensor domain-containing protein
MKNYFIIFLIALTVNIFPQTYAEWIVFDTSNSALTTNHIEEIVIDNLNRKWISLNGNGILKIEDNNWSVFNTTNSSIPSNSLTTINVDNNLNFWAGGYGFITKFDGNTWRLWNDSSVPGSVNVKTSINFDEQNDLWFLSRNGYLMGSIHSLIELTDDSLFSTHSSIYTTSGFRQMLFDNESIWIGDPEGLYFYSGDSLNFIQSQTGPFGMYVTDVKKDSSGNIWIAVGLAGWGNLYKYDGNSFSGFPSVATAIEIDSEGNLWVGTESFAVYAEIIKYDGTNWTYYNPSNSQMPSTIMITDLAFDNFGNLWIGTLDAGLLIFNENGIVPVELINFSANVINNSVTLNWITGSEVNNSGFEIERKVISNHSSVISKWNTINFVKGKGTTTEQQFYSFIDYNLSAGKYSYRLKQIDFDGTFEYSKIVEAEINSPREFTLSQNYPNPFNPTTKIQFKIPLHGEDKGVGFVTLKVYDVLGNEVAALVNEEKEPGEYELEFDGSRFSSGVYYYKLIAGSFSTTKKMILMK